jgi:hypothetical protein
MAHNVKAGGNGLWSLQLSLDEADVLSWQCIPVPLEFKLPHGWHLSNVSYAVPPPLGPEMCALIDERRPHMTLAERSHPSIAQNSPAWPWRFQKERDIKLARSAGRGPGRFNRIGRRGWWQGRDVDVTLAEYGYRSRIHIIDPKRLPLYYP